MTVKTTDTAASTPATPDVDPFTAAFSQFSLEDAGAAPAPKPDETPAAGAGEGDKPADGQGDAGNAADGADEAPEGGEGAAAGSEGDGEAPKSSEAGQQPASGAPEPGAEGSKVPASDDDLLNRFAQIIAERTQAAPKQQEQPTQQTQQRQPQAEQQAPLFTQEEQAVVEEYLKDYGEVERGAALLRRAEYQQLTSYIFNEIGRSLRPFIQNAQAMMESYHLQQLSSSIEDYDDIRDKVVEWAGKQPAYLQAAYKHVIEQGTQDEIVDLVNRFRAETGTQATPKAPAPAPKKQAELPATAKKAAASLAPVSTKRSNASGSSVDPADFDSAFATFASKEL